MANNKIIDLDRLSRFKDKLDIELDKKANVDGNYPTLTAGLADNLTPYSEDSGAEQDNPFISNGTGTNNNTEIVTVGDYGLFKEKQGNTLVVNQYARILNSTHYSFDSSSGSFANGEATFIATSRDGGILNSFSYRNINIINGHNYLFLIKIKLTTATNKVYARITYSSETKRMQINAISNTSWQSLSVVHTASANANDGFVYILDDRESGWDTVQVKDIFLIDLTQMFGSNDNIPQALLDNPDHFSWYYNGSLAYNTGTLVNANGVKLVSTGRNLWDEETKIGYYANTNGNYVSQNDQLCSVNAIRVSPSTTYYVKKPSEYVGVRFYDKSMNYIGGENVSANSTFTTPSNCRYIHINLRASYGTIYNHDITISLYYTPAQGGEGYDKYYPYEQPYEADTGSEVLRQAGSVKDYKEPNGSIHRLVGVVDLGTLTYRDYDGYTTRSESPISPNANHTSQYSAVNALCSRYSIVPQAGSSGIGNIDFALSFNTNNQIFIHDSRFEGKTGAQISTALSGVYLYYELETPTTEQGTPFAENLPINDYGMLYWLDSSNNLVGVPQGAKIFYPTNYKGFVDDMYSRVDGDSSAYVVQSELSASETQRDTIDNQLKQALSGTLRQLLAISQSIDFLNTDWVDLGTLSWVKDGNNFRTNDISTLIKIPANNTTVVNAVCSKYKAVSYDTSFANGMYGVSSSGYLYVRDTIFADATAFKNAMKGILLAYEKA